MSRPGLHRALPWLAATALAVWVFGCGGGGGQPPPPAPSPTEAPTATAAPPGTPVVTTVVARSGGDRGGAVAAIDTRTPWGVAVDASGAIYVSDVVANVVHRVDAGGTVTTVAKDLNGPRGLAVDGSRNLYVADTLGHQVLKVTPQGAVTRVAGIGSPAFSGDGAPAPSAGLSEPHDVALDPRGNLYIADTGNHRVRRVDPSGTITTVAGSGSRTSSGDGGPAVSASLAGPWGVAVDNAGTLYIAEASGARVRKVAADGRISALAGTGVPGDAGDGGAATQALLRRPSAVAVDERGAVYIADEAARRVRRVGADGVIATVAGSGGPATGGEPAEGPAVAVPLVDPTGLAVDAMGRLYIADGVTAPVRRVSF